MSRTEQITRILKTFSTGTPDVEGAAVIDHDGLLIASALPQDFDEDGVGAMTAAVLALGERICGELNRGALELVMVRGGDGYVILTRCGPDTVLVCVTAAAARLGLVFLDLRRTARALAEHLQ